MSHVTELGYLGISVREPTIWRRYATEVMGMQLVDEGEADRFYLRVDEWHHRIVVHNNGGEDGLLYVGWRVAGSQELEQVAAKLEAAGVPFRRGTAEEADERRVRGLLKLHDPDGAPTEIFYSPQVDGHKPFHPGRPMFGRFKTGEQGLGHIILRQLDLPAAFRFYELLGMSESSEYLMRRTDGGEVHIPFMKCNAREHSVAFVNAPIPNRIDHLMFEYTDLRDLGITRDIVQSQGLPVAVELGMHSNDMALGFYTANPSGWLWEPGWNGRPAPAQQEHYRSDVFGHDVTIPEFVGGIEMRPASDYFRLTSAEQKDIR